MFVLRPIEPNYFYCNEMKVYQFEILNISQEFLYPESCDQFDYHNGFENLENLIADNYIYQARPLYIIPVNFIANLVGIFNLSQTTNLLATFLFQNLISYISIIVFMSLFLKIKNMMSQNFFNFH